MISLSFVRESLVGFSVKEEGEREI